MLVRPHRGNTVGAAAVVLAAAVVEAEARLTLSATDRLAVTAALALIAGVLAWSSPRQGDRLRAYQELLHAIGVLAGVAAVAHLVAAVDDGARPAVVAAIAAASGALHGLAIARLRGAVLSLMAGTVLAAVALVAGAAAIAPASDPLGLVRWALLAVIVLLAPAIAARVDHRFREAVVLADVLAIAAVALAASFLVPAVVPVRDALGVPAGDGSAGWGWELVLLGLGFAIVGLSSAVREQGPGWLGAIALLLALIVVSRGDSGLVGWPLGLLVVGLVLLAVGLRPVEREVRDPEEVAGPAPPPVALPARPVVLPPPEDRGR